MSGEEYQGSNGRTGRGSGDPPSSPPLVSARFESYERDQARTMVVGHGTRLSGEIEGCELLRVEGQLCGVLDGVERLEITASGRFAGRAVVNTCRIEGGFEGELTVDGLLSLEAHGRIKGKLRYREIEVARGAVVSGGVDLFSATPFEPASRPLFDPSAGRRGGPRGRPLSFIGPPKEESD